MPKYWQVACPAGVAQFTAHVGWPNKWPGQYQETKLQRLPVIKAMEFSRVLLHHII